MPCRYPCKSFQDQPYESSQEGLRHSVRLDARGATRTGGDHEADQDRADQGEGRGLR